VVISGANDLVVKQEFQLAGIKLSSGQDFGPLVVAYETYGQLAPARDNAILIFHALSGDAHVAGRYAPTDKKPGWWDSLVGRGKAFDTDKYFIICANVLGGCQGSTGPSSINPQTQRPYGLDFPLITIKDMVNVQVALLDQLGIERLQAAVGGSMGGMLALQLAVDWPERVANIIAVATAARVSAQNIAFNEVGRRAILSNPHDGLAIARMIGHITYLSDDLMREKFGRKTADRQSFAANFNDPQFAVESYLQYKGAAFTERFDANSYLYITKAIDLFNLADDGGGNLEQALAKSRSRFLVVHFSSDWLFPEYQALEIVKAIMNNNGHVSYRAIDSSYGHDAFLLESDQLGTIITSFLAGAK